MVYVVVFLVIVNILFEWWVFVVLHNMIQGLYEGSVNEYVRRD